MLKCVINRVKIIVCKIINFIIKFRYVRIALYLQKECSEVCHNFVKTNYLHLDSILYENSIKI